LQYVHMGVLYAGTGVSMLLEGIHHITAITADAPRNVDFYSRLLGLRFVKKTVNYDAPDVYHLYYGDESGTPGSILTFFEFPGAVRGRAGAGMIYRLRWRVASPQALGFWSDRLASEDIQTTRTDESLIFADPEGLELELVSDRSDDLPLVANASDIPPEHRLVGFDGVRAYSSDSSASSGLLSDTLGFDQAGMGWYRIEGTERHAHYYQDDPPPQDGVQGGGTVHHIAWASRDADHRSWLDRLGQAGVRATQIIDRTYFRSIYFREPSGVLFELATLGPGFEIDEDIEHLGSSLVLPPHLENMRPTLEKRLTPLANPRLQRATK
jgi:glyoxalase family protein